MLRPISAGGMAFTLRVEAGPPGRPSGVETFTQVAPVLLAGPRAADAQQYASSVGPVKAKASGVLGQVAAVLPGETVDADVVAVGVCEIVHDNKTQHVLCSLGVA